MTEVLRQNVPVGMRQLSDEASSGSGENSLGSGEYSSGSGEHPTLPPAPYFPPSPLPPSPPPSPPPSHPPFSPLMDGVSVVPTPATVVEIRLTISRDLASFDDAARAGLASAIGTELNCHEPACILELRLSAASISVTALFTIPDAAQVSAVAIASAAANLAAQPLPSPPPSPCVERRE